MALRNQPYLPLYVKDFLTDEKLIECSAESTGVYIRLMCILHNAQNYGQLKLSDKYTDEDIVKNYADMLSKQMPYTYDTIYRSLQELLREKVVFFAKNILTQKRMFNDGLISKYRAKAGSIGGKHTKQNVSKTPSKTQANAEDEIIIENVNINNNIFNYYSNNINNSISGIEYDKLKYWLNIFSEDIIKYAIDICVMNKVKKMNYLNAILNDWKKAEYKTLTEIKENTEKKPKNKNEDVYKEFLNEYK